MNNYCIHISWLQFRNNKTKIKMPNFWKVQYCFKLCVHLFKDLLLTPVTSEKQNCYNFQQHHIKIKPRQKPVVTEASGTEKVHLSYPWACVPQPVLLHKTIYVLVSTNMCYRLLMLTYTFSIDGNFLTPPKKVRCYCVKCNQVPK